jgi:hypothetical protein
MRYICPMHPEVKRNKPGRCPKCWMTLVQEKDRHSPHHLAVSATNHCLTGCAIGEILGIVIGTAAGWSNAATISLAVILAFIFGYSMTLIPLLRSGRTFLAAASIAFASDTASITVMEIVDNAVLVLIPGAMDAGLTSLLFWGSLTIALAIAWFAAYPVNRWLITRGQGHAHISGK